MAEGLNIVVCDDHRVFTDALVTYLREEPGIGRVDAVHTIDDALKRVRQGADVLLLDLALEEAEDDGLTVVEAIGHLGLDVRVLILSGSQDSTAVARALRLGAHGFCTKDVRPEQLVASIKRVVAGEVTLPGHMTQLVLTHLRDRQEEAAAQANEVARFTPREQEILRMLANGRSTAHISRTLGLSTNTVRTHLQNIMRKLGVHTQLHAAVEGRRLFGDKVLS
jgi:DNA-binding NarL/FixJ family response regulator